MRFDGLMEEKEVKNNGFIEISHLKSQGWGGEEGREILRDGTQKGANRGQMCAFKYPQIPD